MPNSIPIHDWLRVIDQEYLSTFVRDGGSSIKFAVTPDERRTDLYQAVQTRCRELGYLFVKLDAVTSRAHMPQDIFFGLARQIDWRRLARGMILRLAQNTAFGRMALTRVGLTISMALLPKPMGLRWTQYTGI